MPFVWEVMHDALDDRDFLLRAMRVLAASKDKEAAQLLQEAGARWAEFEADFAS